MAVPGDCRNTVCISKSPGAVMGKQIHSKPYESLCESTQAAALSLLLGREEGPKKIGILAKNSLQFLLTFSKKRL